jgi:hypothetical protein
MPMLRIVTVGSLFLVACSSTPYVVDNLQRDDITLKIVWKDGATVREPSLLANSGTQIISECLQGRELRPIRTGSTDTYVVPGRGRLCIYVRYPIEDRVKEITLTDGSGSVSLLSGFRLFKTAYDQPGLVYRLE